METIRNAHNAVPSYQTLRSIYVDDVITQTTLNSLPPTPDATLSTLTVPIAVELEMHAYLRDLFGNGD